MAAVIFSQRVEVVETYGERRDCADQRIAEFIMACGYVPIPIPNVPEVATVLINEINPSGIILVGGNSLVKYGGTAPERDVTDKILIELSIKKCIPLYGFCRGMQSILDYFGNNLIDVEGHVAVRHSIFGKGCSRDVNSYHNQACKELTNDELKVIFQSEDGVIESIQHKNLPIVGTMWHPEREASFDKQDIIMVKELFG